MRRPPRRQRVRRSPTRYGELPHGQPSLLERKIVLTFRQVYFDIEHGDEKLGRIVIGLYGKTVPKVCTAAAAAMACGDFD